MLETIVSPVETSAYGHEGGLTLLVEFTDEQELFRSTVRDFCDREISREYVRECDREHRAPVELYERLGHQGWLGINIPEEYGGAGGGAVEVAILLEELGRSFLDLAFWVFRTVTWGGLAIGRDGTDEQKTRFPSGHRLRGGQSLLLADRARRRF